MPGIFGYCSPRSSEEELSQKGQAVALFFERTRKESQFVGSFLTTRSALLGYHSIQKLVTHKGVAKHNSLLMIFDGVLFEPSSQINADALLALYEEHGKNFVTKLRGSFSFVIANVLTGDFYIFTDWCASRPVYYYSSKHSGIFCFAGDFLALLEMLPKTKEGSFQAVTDMLTFGYLIGNKTPNPSVFCLPPASCLHWNSKTLKLEITAYFTADNRPLDTADYTTLRNELQNLFVQAVERSLQGARPLFTLSGGLDSRAILGTAQLLGASCPDCLTFGDLDSLDVNLALRTARETRSQTCLVSLGEGDYLSDTYPTASQYNGGMVYYNGSAHLLYALQKLNFKKWDIVQTGMSGDMLMGSFIKKGDICAVVQDLNLVTDRIIGDLGQTLWISLFTQSSKEVEQIINQSTLSSLKDLNLCGDLQMSQILELWNLYNRQQRGMFNGFRMIENYAEFASPFFDIDLYAYTLKIPHKYRFGEAIYIDMLHKLLPVNLMRIPWAKTGRPPSCQIWINQLNRKGKRWWMRGMRLVRPAQRQSMNPFRAWLLENTQLRQFVVDQLSCWHTVPYPLDSGKVQNFIQKIAKGKVDKRFTSLIFRLLTLRAWETLFS